MDLFRLGNFENVFLHIALLARVVIEDDLLHILLTPVTSLQAILMSLARLKNQWANKKNT